MILGLGWCTQFKTQCPAILPRDLKEKTKMAFLTSVNVFSRYTHIKEQKILSLVSRPKRNVRLWHVREDLKVFVEYFITSKSVEICYWGWCFIIYYYCIFSKLISKLYFSGNILKSTVVYYLMQRCLCTILYFMSYGVKSKGPLDG